MALFRRGKKGIWWYEFVVHGRRYRETTKSTSRTLVEKAKRKRHSELEAAGVGIELEKRRPILFSVAADEWLETKTPTVSPKTRTIYMSDIAQLKAHVGRLLVTDITDRDIAEYITSRRQEKAAEKSVRKRAWLPAGRAQEAQALGGNKMTFVCPKAVRTSARL